MSNQPSTLPPHIEHVFRNLILYFIERQRLVVLAVLDLSPKLLTMDQSANFPSIDLEPYIDRFYERLGNIKSGESFQSGIWKNDWKHWLHGKGCRLTHIQTGERLDWDAPDAHAFRIEWFWNHLDWRLENESDDPFVAQAAIFLEKSIGWDIISSLESAGVIETGDDGISRLKEQ